MRFIGWRGHVEEGRPGGTRSGIRFLFLAGGRNRAGTSGRSAGGGGTGADAGGVSGPSSSEAVGFEGRPRRLRAPRRLRCRLLLRATRSALMPAAFSRRC